ncbi:hypothetical protein H6H01_08600 [Nostoc calcicola FACHB-3891]|nr:hypothetical protein [Nostoc calcicola FACHB-3891]
MVEPNNLGGISALRAIGHLGSIPQTEYQSIGERLLKRLLPDQDDPILL